jgi:hypothetical protein
VRGVTETELRINTALQTLTAIEAAVLKDSRLRGDVINPETLRRRTDNAVRIYAAHIK